MEGAAGCWKCCTEASTVLPNNLDSTQTVQMCSGQYYFCHDYFSTWVPDLKIITISVCMYTCRVASTLSSLSTELYRSHHHYVYNIPQPISSLPIGFQTTWRWNYRGNGKSSWVTIYVGPFLSDITYISTATASTTPKSLLHYALIL